MWLIKINCRLGAGYLHLLQPDFHLGIVFRSDFFIIAQIFRGAYDFSDLVAQLETIFVQCEFFFLSGNVCNRKIYSFPGGFWIMPTRSCQTISFQDNLTIGRPTLSVLAYLDLLVPWVLLD
jgi:hypothetical protein